MWCVWFWTLAKLSDVSPSKISTRYLEIVCTTSMYNKILITNRSRTQLRFIQNVRNVCY